MKTSADLATRRPLRAPRANRSAVVVPGFDEVAGLVGQNVERRRAYDYSLNGRSLSSLTDQAREELVDRARRYTASYLGDVSVATRGTDCVVLAGHQPQLFHPGVWLKNFALGVIGQQQRATAINLVIDSDQLGAPRLRVPTGTPTAPRVEVLAYDQAMPRVAYERRPVLDAETFASFGRRVADRVMSLVDDPLVEEFWPSVLDRAAATGNLGAALAQARHRLEFAWGSRTLEVPQSAVCDSESFRWFAAHLMAEAPRFVEAYNSAVHDFREAHRIRNAAQPVPDLIVDHPWHEAPFWIYSRDNPRRRRFFVKRSAGQLELRDGEGLRLELPSGAGLSRAVDLIGQWAAAGIKIRSRALITTLWARLVLGDLFIHGIGGAHYDQVTDLIMERFFGVTPPGLMVVSATLHLPVNHPTGGADNVRSIRQQLRELTFHPEVHAQHPASADERDRFEAIVDEKRRWIAMSPTEKQSQRRCRAIRAINEQLQPHVAAERTRLESLEVENARASRIERLLSYREYAFCLFPKFTLQEFMTALLPRIA